MGNRRKSREELRDDLVERLQTDEEADKRPEDGQLPPKSGQNPPSDGGAGHFEAISERQREEINELFRLINSQGYLTAGMYDIKADGSGDAAVSLTVILPSSGDVPGESGQSRDN